MSVDMSQTGVQPMNRGSRDHFIQVSMDVFAVLKGTTALSVYMALKSHVNADGRAWFQYKARLAEEAGVSVSTFDKGIKVLERYGLVEVVHRYAPADWDRRDAAAISLVRDDQHPVQIANLYRVGFHVTKGGVAQNMGEGSPRKNVGVAQNVGTRRISPDVEPVDVKDMSGSGEPDVPTPGLFAAAGTPTPAPATPAPKKLQRHKYTPEFEEFWKTYPTARGASKLETSERFEKALQYDTAENIIAGAGRYAGDPQRDDRYTPMPTTWLNKKRWTVEPEAPAAPPAGQARAGGWVAPAGRAPNAWEARLQEPTHQPAGNDYATGHIIIDQEDN